MMGSAMANPMPLVFYALPVPLDLLQRWWFSSPIPGRRGLIDSDTPDSVMKRTSLHGRLELQLIVSDEFNDERAFYPGDYPYWEAVDFHCRQTGNPEWYVPAVITTKDGALKITLSKETHDLDYQGGTASSWN